MTQKELTGYPSIDRPWLKYHNPNAYETPTPQKTAYEYLWENNREHLENVALEYYGRKISYKELFANIEKTAASFAAIGVKEGDMIAILSVTTPEVIYCFYGLNRLGAVANMIDPRTKKLYQ